VREFQELLNSPGWEQLDKYAEKQIQHREIGLHTQATGLDSIISNEFVKGEIAGIQLFLNIPSAVIRDYTEQIDEIREDIQDDD